MYDDDVSDETEFLAGLLEMRRAGKYSSNDVAGARKARTTESRAVLSSKDVHAV